MINCFKDSIHVLMSVLLSTGDDDDDHEEVGGNHVDGHRSDEVREEVDAKENEGQVGGVTLTLKSSLRKADSNSTEAGKKEKKKVQWVDVIGKELAEIREFEPSDEDDIDSDRGKTCVCVIL
ncbi:hypothetical protein CARUB_v10011122mg [Capsella rubella]|uniref:Uncharacterized protein n=1 Tax=Capsella rubella TaxID=81985 RepID=R0GKP2_9BRAS|nr:uncharacterized protein LOC17897002 isoform X2 [Capsella rubella]EOA36487.1 hypothetical protein CARUB_v10011122mg [Capsella rubella]